MTPSDDKHFAVEVPTIEWQGRRMGAAKPVTLLLTLDGERVWFPAGNTEQIVDCILWFVRRGVEPPAARALVHTALDAADDADEPARSPMDSDRLNWLESCDLTDFKEVSWRWERAKPGDRLRDVIDSVRLPEDA